MKMETIHLDELPSHILLDIFSYTENYDLISLTEVCKSFNELISSCRSTMKRYCVYFSKTETKDSFALLSSTRKYQKIKVYDLHEEAMKTVFIAFICNQRESIRKLKFHFCKLTALELFSILLPVRRTLESILFSSINLLEDVEVIPIGFPKLTHFDLSSCTNYESIIELFKGSHCIKVR